MHDSIGTECVRYARLRSVSDRVRLNVACFACIKQKTYKCHLLNVLQPHL